MKILVLGLRGFPEVMGGIETHCEHLYPCLMKLGCQIEVIGRSPYISHKNWNGIMFHRLWTPKIKSAETIVHTFLGVLFAAIKRPDLLHIHAIGPAIMVPLARLMGLRVVVTHHGEDYNRHKWGRWGRLVLRLGERWGMLYADERIVISSTLKELVFAKYGRSSTVIPNGVTLPELPKTFEALTRFDLEPFRYVLLVSRLVPEKRHLDLIKAFSQAQLLDWKLVIVGSSDHPDNYSKQVLDLATNTSNVICTGFQTGTPLKELYAHAGIFVLPSSHEGHPIALLEALSYGLPVLVSDIPAHRELNLPVEQYFPLGDIKVLSQKLSAFDQILQRLDKHQQIRKWVKEKYDWEKSAQLTLKVYESVVYEAVMRN